MVAPVSAQTQRALQKLGIERLVLSIHQLSFPADVDDLGSGTPYARRSRDVLAFFRKLGFTGLALGPGGVTSRANPSPYDGTLFSLSPAFLSFAPLIERGLIDEQQVSADASMGIALEDRRRAEHVRAHDRARAIIGAVRARLRLDPAKYAGELTAIEALGGAPFMQAEAAFEGAMATTGTDDWRRWPGRPKEHQASADAFLVGQWLLREQHARFRADAHALGMQIYADAQVGVSHRDLYLHRGLFLEEYRLGAPPSRTNPEGQPWNYPVLDPAQLATAGRAFVDARFSWLLSMHDGVRLDHPHGWVCPWVYRVPAGGDAADALRAVQAGARLFESPALADHPALAAYARVRADQIDLARPRHDDHWVRQLEPAQAEEYASLVLLLMARAQSAGVDERDLMVEVLSTCPLPLTAVLERCALGRFRVTQKARVDIDGDVYRSDSATPCDWIMAGNHDTPPLRLVVRQWLGTPEASKRARYLARRLEPDVASREALVATLEREPRAMAEAMLADCFVGPARRVIVFWADLFGEERIYNRPGVVHDDNWTLRMAPDFERAYQRALDDGAAPRLEHALAMALHARGLD